ncbi:MAG TPA: hypothetical protein ENK18_17985 [Deltaproteobacteria bacterium]|nr:hypothetical protein [Deltaproteobacteria bacterium]
MRSLLWLWGACVSSDGTPTDTPTDTGDEPQRWHLIADQLPGGVMLAATTVGDQVLISGGSYESAGTLWRYDGTSLCVEEDAAEAALWWVHGRSADDWYAVGEHGIVVHEVAGVRTREDLPSDITLFGLYDDGTAAWIVGGAVRGDQTGEIWRKVDGGDWELLSTTPSLAFKIFDGWVVGDGFVWWWDGSGFVDRSPPDAPRLLTVRTRGDDDVWAVGGLQQAEFWHFDGAAWSEPELEPRCAGQPLNGVYTAPGDDVWLAGNFGTAASYGADTGWDCARAPLTADHFHATWRFGEEVLMVGGNLSSLEDHHATMVRFEPTGLAEPPTFDGACGAP